MLYFAIAPAIILLIAAFIASRPGHFRLERTTTIAAPAAAVFPLINDFRRWTSWSPWEGIDPDLKRTYSGPTSGPGSMYAWSGNKKVGEGRMTIVDSKPAESVEIKLEFLKPFKATNRTLFTLAPSGAGTHVSWAMEGNNNFISKAFCLFMSMEKMVGPDFEKGLAAMKTAAEGKANA